MIQNRKKIIIISLILILISALLVAFVTQPSARKLLINSLEMAETITDGHAVASFELEMPDESLSGTVEVWGALNEDPNMAPSFYIEVLDANLGEFIGVTAVSDGTNFWVYFPEQEEAYTGTWEELAAILAEQLEAQEFDIPEHDPAGQGEEHDIPETAEEAVDQLLQYVTADRNGGDTVGGQRVITIRLVPIPEQMPDEVRALGGYINLWLRPQDKALVGAEFAESAAGYAIVVADTLELNQGIDPTLFTFDPPPGTTVVRVVEIEWPEINETSPEEAAAQADFDLLTPTSLPDEATLVDTAVIRGAIVQQYSLPDGHSFTIAQAPAELDGVNLMPENSAESITVRGVDATLAAAEDGSRALLSWTENGVQIWIGGDLTPEQATAIAESLQ